MVCSMIDFMIEIKKKHKSQQRTKLAENLHNHAHAEMLPTNSKFLHFMWSLFSRVTGELIFHSKHLAIERNILFEFL